MCVKYHLILKAAHHTAFRTVLPWWWVGPFGLLSPCVLTLFRVQHPRRFSKCSISDYKEFLLKGGGSCLFNRPTKVRLSQLWPDRHESRGRSALTSLTPLLSSPVSCSRPQNAVMDSWKWERNATAALEQYVFSLLLRNVGPVCCRLFVVMHEALLPVYSQECYKDCCKKCSLANGAHCSDGPCCNNTCLVWLFFFFFISLSFTELIIYLSLWLVSSLLFLAVLSTRLQLPLRCERLRYLRDLLRGLWTGVLELNWTFHYIYFSNYYLMFVVLFF